MRRELVLLVLATTVAGAVGRAEPRATVAAPVVASATLLRPNAAIETQRARLVGSVRPEVRTKLKDPVRQTLETAGKKTTAAADLPAVARQAVRSTFGDLPATDIETLAMLVMMEAAKDAQEDLKKLLEELKALNKAKDCQRDAKCLDQLASKGEVSKQAADRALDDIKTKVDTLGDLSTELSLRLQMYMERRAKFMETLSNMMKKISDTSSSIVQNLK